MAANRSADCSCSWPISPNSGVVGGEIFPAWAFWQNQVQSFASFGLTPGPATIQTMMNRAWLVAIAPVGST